MERVNRKQRAHEVLRRLDTIAARRHQLRPQEDDQPAAAEADSRAGPAPAAEPELDEDPA